MPDRPRRPLGQRARAFVGWSALFIVLGGGPPALAEVPAPRAAAEEREASFQAVVVAQRAPEDPFGADRSVWVLDERALQESLPRTTPEALATAPGVFLQQTNYGGGSPIVRGMVGPRNLILLDGVRLNNSVYRTGPLQYLNLVDPLALRGIEVLRGPGAVLYGSDAMGGVIQLLPLRPTPCAPERGCVNGVELVRYGSAARERTVHGRLGLGYGATAGLFGATYKAFADLEGGRGIGVQRDSGYHDLSLMGTVEHRFAGAASGWTAKVGYLMSAITDAGRTDHLLSSRSLQVYDNTAGLVYGRLHGGLRPLATTGDLTLSYQHFFERTDKLSLAEDLATVQQTTRDEVRVGTLGLDLQLATRLAGNRLRLQYGGMLYHDRIGADQQLRAGGEAQPWTDSSLAPFPDGSTYDSYGLFLLGQADLLRAAGGHLLRLGAGYRFHGTAGAAPAREELPVVDFVHHGHVVHGSLQYLLAERATVAVTFSQGMRAPNLNEAILLGDVERYFQVPNDGLRPERSDTVELLGRLRVGRLTLGTTLYQSWITDLLARQPATWQGSEEFRGRAVVHTANAREGIVRGLEGVAALALPRGLTLSGHLGYTWGEEIVARGPDVPMTRIPPVFGQLVGRWEEPAARRWRLFVETSLRGAAAQSRLSPEDERDQRIPAGGTPAWMTWNLAGGTSLGEGFAVGLQLQNLLDADYKTHGSGVYGPGTNVVLEVRGAF